MVGLGHWDQSRPQTLSGSTVGWSTPDSGPLQGACLGGRGAAGTGPEGTRPEPPG